MWMCKCIFYNVCANTNIYIHIYIYIRILWNDKCKWIKQCVLSWFVFFHHINIFAWHVVALTHPASTLGKSGCFMKYTVESPGCFASSNFFLSSLSCFAKANPNLALRVLNSWRTYFPFLRWDKFLFELITKAESSQFSPAVSHSSNRVGIIVRSQFGQVYTQTTLANYCM